MRVAPVALLAAAAGAFFRACCRDFSFWLYVRDLLAPPYKLPRAYSPPVLLIVSSPYEAIAILLPYRPLFHRLSCNSCSACLLPTVHLGNVPYTLAVAFPQYLSYKSDALQKIYSGDT